ncbi:MAG: hypothetical protein ACLSAH_06370 [Bilophila wadsworthia]
MQTETGLLPMPSLAFAEGHAEEEEESAAEGDQLPIISRAGKEGQKLEEPHVIPLKLAGSRE